ncbi:hypothetical protein [Bacillus sp. FSL K6-3431]|uniref:hypothetical protein n=1 Tax=Bacillus sp. FSL K6-3431 TaxID=2921500 RepID=UPI0030FB29DD
MHYSQSFEEMESFAKRAYSNKAIGTFYVSQTETAPDKMFFGDEDTGRASVHQILSILLETSEGSTFYEYSFFKPYELEDAFEMIHEVSKLFPKTVLDKDEMEKKLSE